MTVDPQPHTLMSGSEKSRSAEEVLRNEQRRYGWGFCQDCELLQDIKKTISNHDTNEHERHRNRSFHKNSHPPESSWTELQRISDDKAGQFLPGYQKQDRGCHEETVLKIRLLAQKNGPLKSFCQRDRRTSLVLWHLCDCMFTTTQFFLLILTVKIGTHRWSE